MTRNIGKFFISCEVIADQPAEVRMILRDVIVVHARMHWNGFIEYEGLHPDFEEVPQGVYPPRYTPIVHKEDDPDDPMIQTLRVEWRQA